MCFRYGLNKSIKEVAKSKGLITSYDDLFDPYKEINGFEHPVVPIIMDTMPDVLVGGCWGLLPNWAKDKKLQKNTLNARIETLEEKPTFRNVVHNRCLIPATHYYEWRWLDAKGKVKEKHEISVANEGLFCFAGIYSGWRDPVTGETVVTFSIVTTVANEFISTIHRNNRMPVVLAAKDEGNWLQEAPLEAFAFPYEVDLVSKVV